MRNKIDYAQLREYPLKFCFSPENFGERLSWAEPWMRKTHEVKLNSERTLVYVLDSHRGSRPSEGREGRIKRIEIQGYKTQAPRGSFFRMINIPLLGKKNMVMEIPDKEGDEVKSQLSRILTEKGIVFHEMYFE